MDDHKLGVVLMLGLFTGFLVALSHFLPGNAITGNVIKDDVETCGTLGCLELCDAGNGTCSQEGEVCCHTHWSSGVCDLAVNCETVRSYSLYQSLETYQDSVRERPGPVQVGWSGFWLPIAIVVLVLAHFARQRSR